jgi:hypothetical protein
MKQIFTQRHVVHLGGYDPMTPEAYLARFKRELERFARCWSVQARMSDVVFDETTARWKVEVEGPGWASASSHELIRWDDLISEHRSRGAFQRWWRGMASFVDFTVGGALWRYLVVAWRYAAFFLYPYLTLIAAFLLAMELVQRVALAAGAHGLVAALLGAATGAAFAHRLVWKTHLGHLLDDWIFASELVRGMDTELVRRLQQGAERAAAAPGGGEVLVVGHSLGAVLAADLIERALQRAPDRSFVFLALGSSILKIALHAGAAGLRRTLAAINSSGRVTWIEYQSLTDVMNFYRSDPVAVLGLPGPPVTARQVRFSRMLEPAYYARIKRNFFRLHCQFISGNDRRAPFDYLMTLCGPFATGSLAAAPEGPMHWIGDDGRLTASARSAIAAGDAPPAAPASQASP